MNCYPTRRLMVMSWVHSLPSNETLLKKSSFSDSSFFHDMTIFSHILNALETLKKPIEFFIRFFCTGWILIGKWLIDAYWETASKLRWRLEDCICDAPSVMIIHDWNDSCQKSKHVLQINTQNWVCSEIMMWIVTKKSAKCRPFELTLGWIKIVRICPYFTPHF